MTAVATTGTVDCSGLVAGILQRFRAVGTRYAQEVRGDPAAVRTASQQQARQAQQLAQTSRQARQRSTTLASNWEGGAYDTYAAKVGRACDQLDRTATTLLEQSGKLGQAATALDTATRQMTALLADFDGKADRLVAEAHTAAPGAVNAFVQAASRLGQSLVDEGGKVRETLSRALDVLAGNDPTKPEDDKDAPKIELGKKEQKYGIDTWLSTDDLDELMGKKAEPTSTLGKVLDKTSVTAWKWDNDGTPLYEWGLGDKGSLRTDLPGGGAAGLDGSYHLGPEVTSDAKVGFSDNQLTAEAGIKGRIADLKSSAYATIGDATLKGDVEASVGADADVNAKLGLDGGSLHAGGFVGGKLEGSVAADVGGVTAGGTASLRYGLGADVDAKATWHDGHIQVGFKAGAAFGLGASVGGNIDIDVDKAWSTFEAHNPVTAQALRDGASWVGNTASEAGDAIGGVLDRLGGLD